MKPLICIDAGHGGRDPGAVNDNGTPIKTDDTLEKTINLEAALTLKHYLTQRGYPVNLTRADDSYPELAERVKKAERDGAALFISIHHDSPSAQTPGVYYAPTNGSYELAVDIAFALDEKAWVRKTSESRFGGLYIDYFNGPSIMLELGPTAPVSREERIHRISKALIPVLEFLTPDKAA